MVLTMIAYFSFTKQIVCVNDNLWSMSLSFSSIHIFRYSEEVERYDHGFYCWPWFAISNCNLWSILYFRYQLKLDPSVILFSIGINALHDFESKVPLEMDIGRTKFRSSFFFILKHFVRYDNDPNKTIFIQFIIYFIYNLLELYRLFVCYLFFIMRYDFIEDKNFRFFSQFHWD